MSDFYTDAANQNSTGVEKTSVHTWRSYFDTDSDLNAVKMDESFKNYNIAVAYHTPIRILE